ncbi:MAG: hypothetical protein MJY71_00145 [Bacteroidaceae bacterium]|nr:hypothetical protein [Bacteroidaceae bacterium]
MRRILLPLVLSAILLASCNKDPQIYTHDSIKKNIDYSDKTACNLATLFLNPSALPDYMVAALQKRFPIVAGSIDDAQVVFVTSAGLATNKETLCQARDKGAIIVELLPDNLHHSSFWHSIGAISYLDPAQESNDLLLLAVYGGSCYQLQDPFLESNFLTNELDSEDKSPDSEPSERTQEDFEAVPVEIGRTAEYLSTKLNSLVEWTIRQKGIINFHTGNTNKPEFDGNLSEHILDREYSQEITKTLSVGASNFKICKVALSDPDKVTRHSTIDLTIHITPVYSYSINGTDKSGDYYFVTMSMISHNAPLYGLYKKWHGAVRTWAHIFYSKNIQWTATLLDSSHNTIGNRVSFYATPKPESSASGMTYSNGFSAGLNVSGQGGISAGKPTGMITVGGTFTWSSSESRTVQDQSIEMSTGTSDRSVHFSYLTNNLREEDATNDAVPAIARTDQKCEGSWCWRVSGTRDDDNDTKFVLKLSVDPIYGYMWRHATWTCEGESKTAHLLNSDERTLYFEIQNPDRRRNGVLEIKTTNSQYMSNVCIYDLEGNLIAESPIPMEQNQLERFQIPVGTYNVEYQIQDGDTQEVLGEYVINDVEITTAQTTVVSTLNGKKIIR